MNAILMLRDVSRTFQSDGEPVFALRNVTLTVGVGEFLAIMGPSGSGKSTLLNVAGGLDPSFTGEVMVQNQPLHRMSRDTLAELRRRHVGYVFQDFNLVPILTVAENVALPLELDGVPARQARRHAEQALERVGLDRLRKRRLTQISGGERQRVAIARAIVGDRRLVLADEPTGALDAETSQDIMGLLRDLADDGTAVVLVTHEARNAGWADRIAYLRDGSVVSGGDDPARSENEDVR